MVIRIRISQVAAAILAIAVAAVACGGEDEAGVDGNGASSSPQIVEMTVKDFKFVPPKLRGTIGAPIEITLKNTGQVSHTFTIEEFNVDTEVPAGGKTTVTVLSSEPGEFDYYCRFHQDRGMRGVITTTGEYGSGAGAASPTDPPTGDTDGYGY
jgi:plastocyanin